MTKKTTGSFTNLTTPAVDAEYLNIQREEMNNLIVIDGSSLDASGSVNNQHAQSVTSYVSQAGILCTDTGTANNYTLNASFPFINPPLKTGTRVRFKTANANTGSSNIIAFGNPSILCKKSDGTTNLTTGDIPANTEVEFVYNGTNFIQVDGKIQATTSTRGITFLNNPITIANNATTPNTDIDFSGGNFQLNDGSGQAVVSAMTKRLQSSGAWSAGNNGNMLMSGARANSSTYHLYSITNPATNASDYGALPGVAGTAPDPISVLPSGYTKFDLIASVETDASGNIRTGTYTFFRGGYKFKLNGNGVQTYSGTSIATPTLRAILAPRGLSVELDFVVAHFLTSGSGTMGSLYSNEGKTASSTNSQIQGFYSGSAFNYGGSPPNVFSNTSSQVYESLYFGSTTTNTTYITCYGWTFYKK